MFYKQLDELQEARAWYDKSTQWISDSQIKDEMAHRLCAEAAELLGIQDGLNSTKESSPVPDAN